MEIKFKLSTEDYISIAWFLRNTSKKSKIINVIVYTYMIIVILFLINLSLSNNSVKGAILFTICILTMTSIYRFLTKDETQYKVTTRKTIELLKDKKNYKYLSEQKVNLLKGKITHSILNEKFSMEIDERTNILVKEEYIFIYTNNFKEFKNKILHYCNIPVTPCIVIPVTAFNSPDEKEEFIKEIIKFQE